MLCKRNSLNFNQPNLRIFLKLYYSFSYKASLKSGHPRTGGVSKRVIDLWAV
jgi:hypothetical protein